MTTTLHSENFDSATAGALPAGWANKIGTWTVQTVNPVSGANALAPSSNANGDVVLYTGSSAKADQSCAFTQKSFNAGGQNYPLIGCVVRSDAAFNNAYVIVFGGMGISGGNAILFKRVGGAFTNLGAIAITLAQANGDTIHVEVKVIGSTIDVYIGNGSLPGSPSASWTDSSVTAAGYPGFYNGKDGQAVAMSIDDFIYTDLGVSATAPGAPTIGVATASSGAALVPFVAPVSDGGDTITGYTATSSPGGITGTLIGSGSGSIPVGGLTNGVAYTFTVTATNGVGTSAPSSASNSVTPTSSAATAVTMSGPSSGVVSVASTNFTVGANGAITGTVVITPSDSGGGGTFTPTSRSISSGTPSGTFTYTPASTGAKTISVTNNGGLNNPSGIAYTASSASLYTRVDATDTITGQAIMILIPAGGSSNPYNSANPTKTIIYAHGMGEDETGLLADDLKATCVAALLDAGYILAGTNAHGMNWGAQNAVDDYAALDKYLRANYNVAGIGIWSQSMGGHAGLLAIAQNKVRGVVGWLGTYPSCNLAAIYALGSYTSIINTAFGITGSGLATYANKTYGNEPLFIPATGYKHVPMRMYASAGDTVIPKATGSDLLKTLVDGSCRESDVVVCTGNHGHPSHFQPSDYVDFFDRCFTSPVELAGALDALSPTTTTRSVSIVLKTAAGSPRANLSNLKWTYRDSRTGPILSSGTSAVSSGSGGITVSVNTAHSSGGVGWFEITDSDETLTQSPPAKAFCGPVAVN